MKLPQSYLTPSYRSPRDTGTFVSVSSQGVEPAFLFPGAETVCKWGCNLLPDSAQGPCKLACKLL